MEWRRISPRRQWWWLFFLCFSVASSAQGTLEGSAPAIEILKLHWTKQVRLPRNFDPSILPANGVLSEPVSRGAATVASSSSVVSDATRAATSARSEAAGTSVAFPAIPGRLPIVYVYSMKIRNAGPKIIEGIAWDYLFIDPNSNKELGSHQFLSYEKVSTDKIVTLQSQLRSPPTRVVLASSSGNKQRPKFIEQAVIQCLLYKDGTMWRNTQAREGVCDLLKQGKELVKRKHGAGQSR